MEDAFQRALRFLGYRSRSEAELSGHLTRRGYSSAVVAQTVEKLRSLNYLNDETFARDWARSRARSRGYGPNKIAMELRAKGIAPTLLRQAMSQLSTEMDEAANARSVLAKKFKGQNLKEAKTQARAAAFLRRRGYRGDVIYDLLHDSTEED